MDAGLVLAGVVIGAAAALLGVMAGRKREDADSGEAEQPVREMTPEESRELQHWLNLLSYDGTEQEDADGTDQAAGH